MWQQQIECATTQALHNSKLKSDLFRRAARIVSFLHIPWRETASWVNTTADNVLHHQLMIASLSFVQQIDFYSLKSYGFTSRNNLLQQQ